MNNKYNDFDPNIYKYINIDLKHLSDNEAYKHFLNFGIKEGRKYKIVIPSDFDPENYKKINDDLSYLTDDQAFQHFNNYGFYENRKYKIEIPTDFDVKQYKNLNPDLEYMTDEEAINHYSKYGVYENRIYKVLIPYDFNVLDYKKFNSELNYATDIEAYNHYVNYGFIKDLKYKLEPIETNNFENIIDFNLDNFLQIYNVSEDEMKSKPKIEFRYECFKNMLYMRNIELPEIKQNSYYEAVLIEYRCFPHLEFLIRNTINKLGEEWSHTIVCGILNYDYMIGICKNISSKIKVIKTQFENLDQNTYSKMLASTYFWDFFEGGKILIYQEDSIIFKNNIDDFLHWDYIGAPWPEHQNDNQAGVGNGGISLRSKFIMKKIIEKISIEDTIYNSSTINYVTNCKLLIFPEDVYFSKNMEDFDLGYLADRNSASDFSTETIFNKDSFAGHNFWLCDPNWKERIYNDVVYNENYKKYINALNIKANIDEDTLISFINLNKKLVAVYSPYNFTLGGGESYLSKIMNNFINKDYFVIFFNHTDEYTVKNTLELYLNDNSKYILNVSHNFILDDNFKSKINGLFDYFIYLNNISLPLFNGIAKKNIYHCQFPFDYDFDYDYIIHDLINRNTINSYNYIILNSEFTYKYLLETYKKYSINYDVNNIKILYPACIDSVNLIKYEKQKNSFVMVGRIFEYNTIANNKHFDKIIKVLNNFKDFDYELNIIGSVKSEDWYNYLIELIGNNNKIKIHRDISDDDKNNILKASKYYVNLTGFEENTPSTQEHFGISIIEGINYNCIPISYNGGFPTYYIKNNKNGYIVNNFNELENLTFNILNDNEIIDYNKFNNNDFNLNKFTDNSFIQILEEIVKK